MERFPGYTTLRTEPCPEQHGTLTVLTHDVSGATVLLVENEDIIRHSASDSVPSRPMTPVCSTFWNTQCWRAARSTRSLRRFCSCLKAAWHPSSMP